MDRWMKCQVAFEKLGLDVNRFPACDREHPLVKEKFEELTKIKKRAHINHPILKLEEMGCLVSHYKILEEAIKNKYERILIFEDDVIFNKDFYLHIKKIESLNWDIVALGASEFDPRVFPSARGNLYKPTSLTCGTFGYAVNKTIMSRLFKEYSKFISPADSHLINTYRGSKSFVFYPNLVIADVTNSDIRRSFNQKEEAMKLHWRLEDYVL